MTPFSFLRGATFAWGSLKKVTARTPQLYQRLDGGRLTPRQVYFATTLYRIFMALTYTIPSCCMSLLIAFIVPPPGVRVRREVWLIFPPLNLGTHHLDGEQNKIGNNTPAKSRLCEGLLRRSTHFDLGVPQVSKWSKKSSVVYSQAGHVSLLAGNQDLG